MLRQNRTNRSAEGRPGKERTAGLDTKPSRCAWFAEVGKGGRRRGQSSKVFLVGGRVDVVSAVAQAAAALRVVPDSQCGVGCGLLTYRHEKPKCHRRPWWMLDLTSCCSTHDRQQILRDLYVLQ